MAVEWHPFVAPGSSVPFVRTMIFARLATRATAVLLGLEACTTVHTRGPALMHLIPPLGTSEQQGRQYTSALNVTAVAPRPLQACAGCAACARCGGAVLFVLTGGVRLGDALVLSDLVPVGL
jgi:hypothetical protein